MPMMRRLPWLLVRWLLALAFILLLQATGLSAAPGGAAPLRGELGNLQQPRTRQPLRATMHAFSSTTTRQRADYNTHYVTAVGLVRWSELPRAGAAAATAQHHSAASALRAAGYPAVPQLSKVPFKRAADVLAGEQQGRGISAFSLATPIPLGLAGPSLNPSSSSSSHDGRRLQQASAIQPAGGFDGTTSATPAGTAALAAGPHHLLHAAGGLVTLYNLTSSSSSKTGSGVQVLQHTRQSVELASLMSAVSAGCDGVFDPSAVFDAAADRFLVSTTCGGQGLVLLAVSATSDAAGAWFVSALVADGVGTPLACSSPAVESALVDYTQLSYNADGVYVTYKSICPSNATSSGVGLLALPKWALYRGGPSFQFPIFTGHDLAAAVHDTQASSSSSSTCTQLVPVVPQTAQDVGLGSAYFVCEVSAVLPGS